MTVQASLVIQTAFLGDVVLTTPLIAALAKRGPVDVVTTPAAAGLLANSPHIREVIPYDQRSVELVNALASQAAVAIENSLLYEDIEALFRE